jgi:hypothetical protein
MSYRRIYWQQCAPQWLAAARGVALLAWGISMAGVQAQQVCSPNMPRERPDSRYELVSGAVPANSEVRDIRTGLVWQRCALGMEWSSATQTCQLVGASTAAQVATWTEALELARNATPSVVAGASAWRLPSHAELYSLADRSCLKPALNTNWFPGDPSGWFWSSSPNRAAVDSAWIVNTYNGEDFVLSKNIRWFVRLVR